jgi:hypothetical protein
MNLYIIEAPVTGKNVYLVKANTPEEAIKICKKRKPEQIRSQIGWEGATATLCEKEEAPKIYLKFLEKPKTKPRNPYVKRANANDVDWEHWAKVYYMEGVSCRKIAAEIGGSHTFVYRNVKKLADKFPPKTKKGEKR